MESGGLPQLNPEWFSSQLFWFCASFVFLYLMMSRTIVPRIHEVLETRQDRINHDIDWATSLQAEAKDAKDHYEKALSDARKQAQSMLADVSESIKQTAEQKSRELDKTLTDKIAESEALIAEAKAKAQENLTPVARDTTALIIEKLLAEKANLNQIDAVIERLGKETNT